MYLIILLIYNSSYKPTCAVLEMNDVVVGGTHRPVIYGIGKTQVAYPVRDLFYSV